MTAQRKHEIAIERAKKLILRKIVTAKERAPHCCLCREKILPGEKYYRLAGGLGGHCKCANFIAKNNP